LTLEAVGFPAGELLMDKEKQGEGKGESLERIDMVLTRTKSEHTIV